MKTLHHKVPALVALITLGFCALLTRTIRLTTDEDAARRAANNPVHRTRIAPTRGQIIDRIGVPLATTRPSVDLVLTPNEADPAHYLIERLSDLLSPSAVERLQQNTDETSVVIERDLSLKTRATLAPRLHQLRGLSLRASSRRSYPQGTLASHLLGFLNQVSESQLLTLPAPRYQPSDVIGVQGLEARYNDALQGHPGWLFNLRSARHSLLQPKSKTWADRRQATLVSRSAPAKRGHDLFLTLDLSLQAEAEEALSGYRGSVVLIDVNTGALLVYASSPSFSPEELSHRISAERWGVIQQRGALIDRAANGLYAPASTFKIVTAAAALLAGISPERRVNCTGSLSIGGRRFHCWRRAGHGSVNLVEALQHSCDTWFYQAGLAIGPDAIARMAAHFGLGQPTGWTINAEKRGLIPDRSWHRLRHKRPWSDGDTANASIGQGMNLATPLQLAVMVSAIANGGHRVTPWVVERIEDERRRTRQIGGAQPSISVGLSPALLAPIQAGLRAVVQRGTAARSRLTGLDFSGKTGTAQTVSLSYKRAHPSQETEDNALFVGYAPADEPQVAIAVVLEHAGGGSRHAAPIAARLFKKWGEQRAEGAP